jgi:hypothetical protein
MTVYRLLSTAAAAAALHMLQSASTAANPTLVDLGTFRHEVLAPFILSEEQHAQACSMPISHDTSLPHPEDESANNNNNNSNGQGPADGEEFSMASGGAGQQQQQQQQHQDKLQPFPGTQALSKGEGKGTAGTSRQPQGKL